MFDLQRLVIDNLRAFNKQLPQARRIAENPEAVVSGPGTSFDSLDTVELVMALEEEFGHEIPDEQAEKLQSVGDVIKYIEDVQQK